MVCDCLLFSLSHSFSGSLNSKKNLIFGVESI